MKLSFSFTLGGQLVLEQEKMFEWFILSQFWSAERKNLEENNEIFVKGFSEMPS